jgi:hypothetical protein
MLVEKFCPTPVKKRYQKSSSASYTAPGDIIPQWSNAVGSADRLSAMPWLVQLPFKPVELL